MENEFLIEEAQPEQDLSYPYIEKSDDLCYIQKGVKLKNFRENMLKRNLDTEYKLLRRLTENQMYTNQFRDYNPEIVKLDRYNQIVPFKHTMVKLPQLTTDGGDPETYINANFIASSRKSESKAFIATQGPLEITREHFWRMIWHNNVNVIVMLCRCKEGGKSQSDQYWKNETWELGNYKITMTQEAEIDLNLTKRTFSIEHIEVDNKEQEQGQDQEQKPPSQETKQRIVTHYQWIGWPDHGIPSEENLAVMEQLVDIMYKERAANPNSPVVIHCSAGIGRSGTIIALYNLDIVLKENLNALDKVRLSVFGVVRRLREQRWGMVNTADQYALIYKLMADRIDRYLKNPVAAALGEKTQEGL